MSQQPYYSDDLVTLYHGRWEDVLPRVQADVLVTDPPYGMKYRSGWSGGAVAGDGDTETRDALLAAWGDRPALVFGRWNVPRPTGARARLVWDKGEWPGMGDLAFPWGPSDEEVYVLGDGWTGKREGTVLRAHRIGGAGTHPTEKPIAIMERLIRKAPPGIILDPFAGSGTTLVAAKNLGRRAIGIEMEEGYCSVAARRLSQGTLNLGGVA